MDCILAAMFVNGFGVFFVFWFENIIMMWHKFGNCIWPYMNLEIFCIAKKTVFGKLFKILLKK